MPTKSKAKTRRSKDPCADLKRKLKGRTAELKEAHEQQAAVSDILRVISGASTDVLLVLKSIAEHAMRLCQSRDARIWLVEGDRVKYVTGCGGIAPATEGQTISINRQSGAGQAILDRKPVHIKDALAVSQDKFPIVREMQRRHGHRTMLTVPLMRKKQALGAIVLRKMVVQPFTKRQIALVQTFADQAVIAIENVRLFKELQARNAELTESLEQQKTTSEILRIISSSPTDTQPVFDAIAQSAQRLFHGNQTAVILVNGNQMERPAYTGGAEQEQAQNLYPMPLDRSTLAGRAIVDRGLVHVRDTETEADLPERARLVAEKVGFRAAMIAPMLRGNLVIGAAAVSRAQPGGFTDKEIALLKTFADQAVIAIENVRLFKELQARNAELTEALEQQTATSEILGVISSSPTDLQPVFDAILENATRLCDAHMGNLELYDGDTRIPVAQRGGSPEYARWVMNSEPLRIVAGTNIARMIAEQRPIQIADLRDSSEYRDRRPNTVALVEMGGARTYIVVPMVKEGRVVGGITVYRPEVRPFTQKQIDLVSTFASQAVIAIENVRLFKELQARNAELTESLEQQTVTSEILRIISSSPTDTQPVFDAIVKSGVHLFGGADVALRLAKGDQITTVASTRPHLDADGQFPVRRNDDRVPSSRAMAHREVVHVPDIFAEDAAEWIGETFKQRAERRGYQAILSAPMLRGSVAVGAIVVTRATPGAFNEKQIALLKTFADQAVIAIENVRLFNETKEALEQQTVISEILRVISSSPTDTQPVFDAIVKSGGRLFSGMNVTLRLVRGAYTEPVASTLYLGEAERYPVPLSEGSPSARAILRKEVVQVHDMVTEDWVDELSRQRANRRGFRSFISAPLVREDVAVGVINVLRASPGAFTDKQVALLKTFADQAVIAIENVRLFKELQARNAEVTEALEQQTATSEILGAISRSPTDVMPVFETLMKNAANLCGSPMAAIFRFDGELVHLAATHNWPAEALAELDRCFPTPPNPALISGRVIISRSVVRESDALSDPNYDHTLAMKGKWRRVLGVPLLRDGAPIGAINLAWPDPGDTPERQVELLKTFASQAVIAIENVRLFRELQARNADLTEALEQQTATSEILRIISSSPTNIQPVFDAILEHATRLCDAHMGILGLYDGANYQTVAQRGASVEFWSFATSRGPFVPHAGGLIGRMIAERQPIHVPDYREFPAYRERNPNAVALVELGGAKTFIAVPMLKDGRLIGGIQVYRPEVRPFTQKQIDLVSTFASQAVIAIENVRLFKELQAKNVEVTEALEQQTATAEILSVISKSPTDTQPVFNAIVNSGVRLFRGLNVSVLLVKGDQVDFAASTIGEDKVSGLYPFPLEENGMVACRAILRRELVQVPDVFAEDWISERMKQLAESRGFKAVIVAPLLRESKAIGAIGVTRATAGPFSDKEVALLRTFADQAVIAIENVRLFNETKEALEQQTATAEILKVISSSPTDVQPVFDAIVQSGVRLFDGAAVAVALPDGDQIRAPAIAEGDPERAAAWKARFPFPFTRDYIHGAAILDCQVLDVPDAQQVEGKWEAGVKNFLASGYRAITIMPMVRSGSAIGAISVLRLKPGPLSAKQISLLRTFADQAVIAIENVRLFNETKEALEQQTVISEILRVISRSPTDTQPVFDAIVKSGVHLFGGLNLTLRLVKGDHQELVASTLPVLESSGVHRFPLADEVSPASRAILKREIVQIPDIFAQSVPEILRRRAEQGGFRSLLTAPLLREGKGIGAIQVLSPKLGRFTDKQIALLQTFADQAVIAIENVRLFKELQARNAEITEALERQTATAEILRVIGSSMTDTQPVFDAIVGNCGRLFASSRATLWLIAEGRLLCRASTGFIGEPMPIDRESAVGACVLEGRTIHLPDLDTAAERYPRIRQLGLKHGYHSGLYAPLLREGRAIGGISVLRGEAGAFGDKDVALLDTFADQAVIAIENVRLFKELQTRNAEITEALEQQTATSEILGVISQSPTDVAPVFETIMKSAARLCGSPMAAIFRFDGELVHIAATHNWQPEALARLTGQYPCPPNPAWVSGKTVLAKSIVRIPDALTDPDYDRGRAAMGGWRRIVGVPLMRGDTPVGAFAVAWPDPGETPDSQVALLKTFADQAVIAIENVRLFKELQARNAEVTEALEQQTATAEILRVISSSPTDVQPVFDAIVQSAVRLFHGKWVRLFLVEGDRLYMRAYHGPGGTAGDELIHSLALHDSVIGQAILNREALQIPDYEAPGIPDASTLRSRASGIRSTSIAPLMRKGEAIGAITVPRAEPGELSEKQMSLLKTFADQAVIAIENVRLFHEIQDKSRQLEIANKHKSDFLANMSHELRTPLNAIIGFSEMLLARMFGETNAKQEEFLRDIHSSGEHLLSLINDILDLSKIEAGRMELNLKVIDPALTLENTVMLVKERAARRGITVKLEVDEALDKWVADERKIRQIMLNLLSNALKFTPEGGEIRVKAAREGSDMAVAVSDTGIGIKPEDQALIFEEFQQVGSDYTKKAEGTGLGLALTRRFVELHGGTIRVESAEGKGSTFTFTLPEMQET